MSPFIGCIVFQHLTSYWLICVINLNNLPLTSWLLYHHLTSYWQIVESTSCWLVYQHLTFQWFTSVLTSCLLLVDYCINISPLIGFQFLPLIGCSSNNAHIARLQLKYQKCKQLCTRCKLENNLSTVIIRNCYISILRKSIIFDISQSWALATNFSDTATML